MDVLIAIAILCGGEYNGRDSYRVKKCQKAYIKCVNKEYDKGNHKNFLALEACILKRK